MKKYILILTLLLINIVFLIQKLIPIKNSKINIKLNNNELGILFINKNLLFSLNKLNILYIINYKEYKNIDKFNIDYVVMNQKYNININNKKIINDKLTLNNIEFNNNKIIYNDNIFCLINDDDCDYIYDTLNNLIIIDNKKYKIYNNTLLKINDTYEITYLK